MLPGSDLPRIFPMYGSDLRGDFLKHSFLRRENDMGKVRENGVCMSHIRASIDPRGWEGKPGEWAF